MKRSYGLTMLCLVPLVASVCGPVMLPAHADDQAPKVMLLLDASSSMGQDIASGGTRLEAAKGALISSLDVIPEGVEVGLRVYGATQGSGEAACSDTQVTHPIAALNKPELGSAIEAVQPGGAAPMAQAVTEAVKDLGQGGKRQIILVSDGQDTCTPDPCKSVREATGGAGVQMDVVGLEADDNGRRQLQCIAEMGNGSYYEAGGLEALRSSLQRVGARAARPYTVQGTPVRGASDQAAAPVLELGQYTDVSPVSSTESIARYYRVKRRWPGSTLRVSSVTRMPGTSVLDSFGRGAWKFQLSTPEGLLCSDDSRENQDAGGLGTIVASTVMARQLDPRLVNPKASTKECAEAGELVYKVERGLGSGGEVPFELRVIEEPPVEDAGDLPQGVQEIPQDVSKKLRSPASGEPQTVVGGASFNDATELVPGTYTTELLPGEKLFFKTRVEYGQESLFAMDGVRLRKEALGGVTVDHLKVASDVYAPDFSQVNSEAAGSPSMLTVTKESGAVLERPVINQVPEVRFRNRWDSPLMFKQPSAGFSMAGYYYFAVGIGNGKLLAGQPANIDFSFQVSGQAGSDPSSSVPASEVTNPGDANTPGSSPSADPETDGGKVKLMLYVAGGALIVMGGGGLLYALRRMWKLRGLR